MGSETTVRCRQCGTLNKIPPDKAGQAGRCGQCKAALPPAAPGGAALDVTDRDFHETVLASPVPVLLEFWAPNCGHCVKMHPVMDEIAAATSGKLRVAKMDVNANPRIPFDYGVRGTPTFVVIKGGKIAEQFVGAMPGQEIMKRVEKHL